MLDCRYEPHPLVYVMLVTKPKASLTLGILSAEPLRSPRSVGNHTDTEEAVNFCGATVHMHWISKVSSAGSQASYDHSYCCLIGVTAPQLWALCCVGCMQSPTAGQ